MLRQTFIHLPGIGPAAEAMLWRAGVDDWSRADPARLPLGPRRRQSFQRGLEESQRRFDAGDLGYFAQRLRAAEHWRLYPGFQGRIAYLDIETTGLGGPGDHITTIALYDGQQVHHYIHGRNLDRFSRDIADFDLLVTYNGKCFDVPFIQSCLPCRLTQPHLDLRYLLGSLGYRGGLKGCERALGLPRPGLEDVDGLMAVMLWHEHQRTGSEAALDTLLAYNIEDVLTLERLAVLACNRKIAQTPFASTHTLPPPRVAPNPFQPDRGLIHRLRRRLEASYPTGAW